MSERVEPRDVGVKRKAYAFERSLGIPPAEACRRAGGKVENGQATKWEHNKGVQAWISYYRSFGLTEEMLAAKRSRIETALSAIAYGNGDDFQHRGGMPELDWPHRLNALAQLRDMHGFKAPNKTALTDPAGKHSAPLYIISDKPMSEAEWVAQRASLCDLSIAKLSDEQLAALDGIYKTAGASSE
jgi:hypothetical protein